MLEALHDTEPTPGPAAGSSLLTSSHALGRSNRNLTCRVSLEAQLVLCFALIQTSVGVPGDLAEIAVGERATQVQVGHAPLPFDQHAGTEDQSHPRPVQLSQMHQMGRAHVREAHLLYLLPPPPPEPVRVLALCRRSALVAG